ncbi:MAG: sodium-dependent bicarbonate transport family permease [Chloroflexi bacterium]|nr:sodium-dependent bicarbonate transport family permease [Chloroflexota bacterium]
MSLADILRLNLLSPMVLSFVLGVIAVRVKSDLKIPEQINSIITIYLLFAIGLKGGFELARSPSENLWGTAAVAAILGASIPLWSYVILCRFVNKADAISLGMHFGAASAVTLSASITFLREAGQSFEGFMPTMYVVFEICAVVVGLSMASRILGGTTESLPSVLRSSLSGKSFLLLGGGVAIGVISGESGYQQVSPFFVDLFSGFLTLFLLEMGSQVGRKLRDVVNVGLPLLAFGVLAPPLHGAIGVLLGSIAGLSAGGAMILGTLAASASYITAPAVVGSNMPQANTGLSLTASLVIVFPLNLIVGLPIYFELARALSNVF